MVRARKLGEQLTGTFRARRSDGTAVTIEEVTIMLEDPTLTGSIWKAPPMRQEILRLRGGGWVTDLGDGILTVDDTGERLTRI